MMVMVNLTKTHHYQCSEVIELEFDTFSIQHAMYDSPLKDTKELHKVYQAI